MTAFPSSEHIVASVSEPGAGPSYSVRALAKAMALCGADVGIAGVANWRGHGAPEDLGPSVSYSGHRQDLAGVPILGAACLSADLARRVRSLAASRDILHGHGLWLAPALYPAWAARRRRAEFIVSPRGMLSPAALAFSRTRKQVFWRLFQRRALESAACLHATSEAELEDIRAAGLRNPVAVIPNGVDLAEPTGAVRPSGLRTILSLGRIHPKKGLDQLVRAWARLEAGAPQWRLRIVGPAELGHDRELAGLAASLGLTRLSIEGPAYGPEKQAAYEQSDLFVLPTRGENFAMTVAEALAAGAPVISTKGAPWKGLQTNGCGWWTDHGAEALAAAMQAAMAKPADELSAMGARGRAWMARDFGWRRIAEDMLEVYRWTTLGGSPPPTVRLV